MRDEDLTRLSPLQRENLNLRAATASLPAPPAAGDLPPLRDPDIPEPDEDEDEGEDEDEDEDA
ncbi:hypothetical protein AB0892_23580 [Streptomyces sp. NPDC005409]|uniref:hypothetical protein n=1 Tax=Streptomyces sp. NPDC005409 TaxID=3155342 RepID=UPI003451C635